MMRTLRVVVADDERDTREYLQQCLTRMGHQVAAATTGRQALDLARQLQPDLLFTDIKMPDMDGIEAATALNRERVTPVILLTGHHDAELLRRAAQEHVMAYLIKPVDAADVEAAVTVAMARFEEYQAVRKESADLKQALEDRKLIERAKGSVMKRLGIEEDEAFRRMRKLASDGNQRLAEVARRVLAAEEVFQQFHRVDSR